MIESSGGIVSYDLPPPERRAPRRASCSPLIAWYVVRRPRCAFHPAAIRESKAASGDEDQFLKKRTEAIKTARLDGIRPLSIERLLNMLGYSYSTPLPGRTEAKNKTAIDTLLHPKGRTGVVPGPRLPPRPTPPPPTRRSRKPRSPRPRSPSPRRSPDPGRRRPPLTISARAGRPDLPALSRHDHARHNVRFRRLLPPSTSETPMPDPRWDDLADILIRHSTRLEAGETLLIECFDLEDDTLPRLLVRKAARKGAFPLVETKSARIVRELVRNASEPQMTLWGETELHRMKGVQAYIALRGSRNISEMADVPPEKLALYNTHYMKPVHFERRITQTKWCVLRLPGPGMAQQAGMSTEAFEDFYFDVCNLDYPRLARALKPLVERMEAARDVRITGPETDLTFSIAGIPVVPCAGEMNIPDGEVFTAPVRDSVEGHVRFNAPTIYQGASFDGVRLEFEGGKIVEADCDGGDKGKLAAIFDSDDGARYIGEWSIGCNPRILHPMRDILFDEKIAGSFHLTPGNAYDEADNGNRSKIHWDLVQIQRPEFGGGTIAFDGVPIRVDGRFVPEDLKALDPE